MGMGGDDCDVMTGFVMCLKALAIIAYIFLIVVHCIYFSKWNGEWDWDNTVKWILTRIFCIICSCLGIMAETPIAQGMRGIFGFLAIWLGRGLWMMMIGVNTLFTSLIAWDTTMRVLQEVAGWILVVTGAVLSILGCFCIGTGKDDDGDGGYEMGD
eukprot:TRINITY_DN2578_c0_g1_i1.p3 TRINITY_DN2578_c0_g1~~TRINITY_DN2578_c0_g1_i1.p3  ORF type:complete len:156 (+),score=39.06 TRINITY_DN2578_c0_g1_i1:133-600(+)